MKSVAYRYPTQFNNGDKVKIYRNLHKDCYSIVALTGEYKGKVVGHAKTITLANVTTKVNEKNRQKVIAEKRKNVHAYIVGQILDTDHWQPEIDANFKPISYNPYKFGHFYLKDTLDKFEFSKCVNLTEKGMLAYKPTINLIKSC